MVGAHPTLNGPIDGWDISAVLANPDSPSPQETKGFFYCLGDRVSAVRVGNLKLRRGTKPQLHDLEADAEESNNLATERPADVARLESVAAEYGSEMLSNARQPWRMKD
jgi:hypothetical protein